MSRPAEAIPGVYFQTLYAIWVDSAGPQKWVTGYTLDAYSSVDSELCKLGMRLHDLVVEDYREGVTAYWRPGQGEQRWHIGLNAMEFRSLNRKYYARGLRLRAINWSRGYCAIWRSGEGEQHTQADLTREDFVQTDAELCEAGLRVSAIEKRGSRYWGVWQPGDGVQWIESGTTEPGRRHELQQQGLVPRAVAHGDTRVTVWRPGRSRRESWMSSGSDTPVRFREKDREMYTRGYRLAYLNAWR